MAFIAKDIVNLFFMLISSGLLAWGFMSQGGPRNVFTYHPFLMSIGFSLLITFGFWMFNYEELPGKWSNTRESRRSMHAICQGSGCLCIVAGYVAVVLAHRGDSRAALFQVSAPPVGFPWGPSWLRLAHIVLGYLGLLLLPLQVAVGILKYRALTDQDDDNDSSYTLHEYIGNAMYFCGTCNVVLGMWLWEVWSLPVRCVISCTTLTCFVFGMRWDGSRGFLSDAPERHHHHHHEHHHHEHAGGGGGQEHGHGRGSTGGGGAARNRH
mmetsp:Transcript_52851/g.169262  ORF Transcript_52851/g.169262 Transcript_52851/m.169262 type:complete len:267 (-) Transcript_52851:63-863(-)